MHEMTTTNCWGTFKIQHNYLFCATTKKTKRLLAIVVVVVVAKFNEIRHAT